MAIFWQNVVVVLAIPVVVVVGLYLWRIQSHAREPKWVQNIYR